ncbi:peptide deformylase [Dysgonomonas sp. OttesenSCG-928-D17]|nr:peptide deformylase [Dysgonomonas sp. OttesenSCG-928-D17]
MKRIIYMLILFVSLSACNSVKYMTDKEKLLINNGDENTPYRVLLTTSEEDSLFLRKKAIDIDVKNIATDKDLQFFIHRLQLTLAEESGVGIAAPQVGIGRNLFLFMRIDKPDIPVQVAINPRITGHSENMICFEGDGCLSVPDMSGNTMRYEWIDVEYYDQKGDFIKERLSGSSRQSDFTGIIFQHEFDHLQGTLFFDRLCE